jgi:hypothetical protein
VHFIPCRKPWAVLKLVRQCDENRPVCVNCVTAGLQCAFLREKQVTRESCGEKALDSPALSGSGTSVHITGLHEDGDERRLQPPLPLESSPTPRPPPSPQLSSALNTSDPHLNLDYLELLHHFCTVTYETLTPEPAQQQVWQSTVINLALSFPFLMHEILAIAALHMAHLKPERQGHYYTKATELQSHAINEFNPVRENVGRHNCGAIMIFASLLALHMLADPPRRQGLNFNEYLDHFMGCINLMRGMNHMVISNWWSFLSESELKPLLQVKQPEHPYIIPNECRELAELTRNADLGAASIEAYDAAIDRLLWAFAASATAERAHSTIRFVLAWPGQLKDPYLELLNERRPEALIVLAYYGVLLHYYRESWAVGDSGASLVKAINAHTGPSWRRWMAWPNRSIELASQEL